MINDSQRERRAEWVRELIADRLPQATGKMTDGTGYCCLAVAEYSRGHRIDLDTVSHRYSINGEHSTMSSSTAFDLGFLEHNPMLWVIPAWVEARIRDYEDRYDTVLERDYVMLSFLNDSLQMTFPEIAKAIGAQPPNWTGVRLAIEDVQIEEVPE